MILLTGISVHDTIMFYSLHKGKNEILVVYRQILTILESAALASGTSGTIPKALEEMIIMEVDNV